MRILRTDRFARWFDGLRDHVGQGLIALRIERIACAEGLVGDCKPLGEGVTELRIDHGPGYRVYVTVYEGRLLLLLAGGKKGTQARDIRLAKRLARDWRKAHE